MRFFCARDKNDASKLFKIVCLICAKDMPSFSTQISYSCVSVVPKRVGSSELIVTLTPRFKRFLRGCAFKEDTASVIKLLVGQSSRGILFSIKYLMTVSSVAA